MMTQWDDERVLARVEAREASNTGQQDIEATVGYVVRLYDAGPLDGRLGDPRLVFDSEVKHGSLGVFMSEAQAEGYRDRKRAAHLAGVRWVEELRAEREHRLPELTAECKEKRAQAAQEASEARARGKAALDRQDALAEEARNPVVVIECPPNGTGWSVSAGVCVTEGEGEPRRLAEVLPDEPQPRRPRKKTAASKGKKAKVIAPSIEDAIEATLSAKPTNVPDCKGLPISIGAKVWHVNDEFEAKLAEIHKQDVSGDWSVTIEDRAGIPLVCLSTELERVEVTPEEPEEQPDDGDDWP